MLPSFRAQLLEIRGHLLTLAGPDTAYCPEEWQSRRHHSPLVGHCGAVAWLLQQRFGGQVVSAQVLNPHTQRRERHLWNVSPDGEHYDLTSCQYDTPPLEPIKQGGMRISSVRSPTRPNKRYQLLLQRLTERENNVSAGNRNH